MNFMDMENVLKEYLLSREANVSDIEDFLGYPVSTNVLEELEAHIDNVLEQMPDEVLEEYYRKFCK